MTSKHSKFSQVLLEEMFKIKSGETVAITADSGSDPLIISALAKATEIAGGIPLTMWIPRAIEESQAGMKYWPSKALTAALSHVDVWIEANSMVILYSDIWEKAFQNNKQLRYLIIGDSTIESLYRVFTGYSIPKLKTLLIAVRDLVLSSKTIRITSKNGTDISYDIDLNYTFDIDDGDYSEPKFGTAPGFVNIVPKLNSMNGTIVFDFLQHASNKTPISFIMKNGRIDDVLGGVEAIAFKEYLASFNDENMYKISHNMIG
jgi:leucyl aminopeptidase (aminopeptidase T)